MINWDDFEHIHVIRKIKEILGSWWTIDVLFTDERGRIKGVNLEEPRFNNFAVDCVFRKEAARAQLEEIVESSIEHLIKSGDNYYVRTWDAAGFDMAVVPIIIENDFVGTVIALGFLDDQQANRLGEVKERLAIYGFEAPDIERATSQIKYLDGQQKKFCSDLVKFVSQEIITLHLEITSRENQLKELNKGESGTYKFHDIIGQSEPMRKLFSILNKIQQDANNTVLIQGENGTGKELIARAIHYSSPRADRPFVAQNCSAFNDNLLESELFGHMKGSFTNAVKDKKGLFEVADGGTFFLDEIGDTSPAMQVKLLRVLQEKTFTPVGATAPKKVDVRIIAATNKDLRQMMKDGTFREDLYFRLNVLSIEVPALRERKEDIPLLVNHFIANSDYSNKTLTPRTMKKLYDYEWPGNVRELHNEIESVLVLSGDQTKIPVEMLSPRILKPTEGKQKNLQNYKGNSLKEIMDSFLKDVLYDYLRKVGDNNAEIARQLGVSRTTIIAKRKALGLEKVKIKP